MAGGRLLSSPLLLFLIHFTPTAQRQTQSFSSPPIAHRQIAPIFPALYAAVPTCGEGRFGFGWVTYKWTFLFPKSWRLKTQFQLYGKSISSFSRRRQRRAAMQCFLLLPLHFHSPSNKSVPSPSYLLSFFSIEISALFDVGRHPPTPTSHVILSVPSYLLRNGPLLLASIGLRD